MATQVIVLPPERCLNDYDDLRMRGCCLYCALPLEENHSTSCMFKDFTSYQITWLKYRLPSSSFITAWASLLHGEFSDVRGIPYEVWIEDEKERQEEERREKERKRKERKWEEKRKAIEQTLEKIKNHFFTLPSTQFSSTQSQLFTSSPTAGTYDLHDADEEDMEDTATDEDSTEHIGSRDTDDHSDVSGVFTDDQIPAIDHDAPPHMAYHVTSLHSIQVDDDVVGVELVDTDQEHVSDFPPSITSVRTDGSADSLSAHSGASTCHTRRHLIYAVTEADLEVHGHDIVVVLSTAAASCIYASLSVDLFAPVSHSLPFVYGASVGAELYFRRQYSEDLSSDMHSAACEGFVGNHIDSVGLHRGILPPGTAWSTCML